MSDEVKIEDVPPTDSETNVMDDSSVTMMDVLKQQEKLEEESAAVLGGSDEKSCTYERGYIKRQALYSCLTCCPEARNDPSMRAGVCLACSYQCHENHELVELYTKRNFRCDCPTSRIPGQKCTFAETSSPNEPKHEPNKDNSYNQNFFGLYCTCKRPYPDPEDSIPDEMIQCVLCEDWYHTRHLNAPIPAADSYSEMICDVCMEKHSFLRDYSGLAVNKVEPTNESANVSVLNCTTDEEKLRADLDKSIADIMPNISSSDDTMEDSATISGTHDEGVGEPATKKPKLDEDAGKCRRPPASLGYKGGAVFWPDNWRSSLCSCQTCSQIYESQKVSFLLDPEDTVQFYEENGLKKVVETDYERGIRAFSTMGRTQQIDALTEYNRMKEKLQEFLRTFAVNKKVVTEEDINTFFQGMKNEKNANVGQPYFCR